MQNAAYCAVLTSAALVSTMLRRTALLTLLGAALGLQVSPAARPRSAHALRAALRMAELNVDPSKDATAFNPADEIDMDVGPAEDGLPEVDWTPSVRGESPTPTFVASFCVRVPRPGSPPRFEGEGR